MNQEDLKAVYFGYFDQLPEPWASQAKDAFSKCRGFFYEAPASLSDALDATPLWNVSDEQNALWTSICDALEQGWNYLPVLPADAGKVYEVACLAEDGAECVMRCAWNGDGGILEPILEAPLNFIVDGERFSLYEHGLTPYAWREVPTITMPPRPQ